MPLSLRSSKEHPARLRKLPSKILRRAPVLAAGLLLLFVPVSLASAAQSEQIIVDVTLNGQPKGDHFVILDADGNFLFKASDLTSLGLTVTTATIDVAGEKYVPARALQGVTTTFDDKALALHLQADPKLLPKTLIDYAPRRKQNVYYPRDTSMFLNYAIDAFSGGAGNAGSGFSVNNELGLRGRDLLFVTGTSYSSTAGESRLLRLNTSVTWDRRERMQRVVFGDFISFSGDLGSRVAMGGVSFSKLYSIDPYFVRYPLFDLSGLASHSSTVDLYVDGVKYRSEKIAPGEFRLQNFQGIGGVQEVEVVVRDAFGREQRYARPFYLTDMALRPGLHEYSYNLGAIRNSIGMESNDYGEAVFSGFHRYGLSDRLTVGLNGEVSGSFSRLGGESLINLAQYGLLRVETAASMASEGGGFAALISYEYRRSAFRGTLGIQRFTEQYRSLATPREPEGRRKSAMTAGIGAGSSSFGSFNLDYLSTETFADEGAQGRVALSWSRRLWKGAYLNISVAKDLQQEKATHMLFTLTKHLDRHHTVSAGYRNEQSDNAVYLEARKEYPVGEGSGWSVRAEKGSDGEHDQLLLTPAFQYNGRFAALRGDVDLVSGGSSRTRGHASVAGSVLYLGNTFAAARPVTDSFTLVKVGEAEGVRVSVNSQVMGTSDSAGRVILPSLISFYENQIAIEDKDVPLDFVLSKVRVDVSPPYRSGSCVFFPLQKAFAVTGTILFSRGDGAPPAPLAYAELVLAAPGGNITFWTGGKGEFYLDSGQIEVDILRYQGCSVLTQSRVDLFPSGIYPVTLTREGEVFTSRMTIPEPVKGAADAGTVLFTAKPLPKGAPSPGEGLSAAASGGETEPPSGGAPPASPAAP